MCLPGWSNNGCSIVGGCFYRHPKIEEFKFEHKLLKTTDMTHPVFEDGSY